MRNYKRAAAAAVLVGGTLGVLLASAPAALAEQTVSVWEVCEANHAGSFPVLDPRTPGQVRCAPGPDFFQQTFMPGGDGGWSTVRPGMKGLPDGSYRVNPWDLFSDWVIPG